MRSRLFVDTGAFIALINARDDFYTPARAFYERLPDSVPLLTTQAIIAETYTFFRYHDGTAMAKRWLDYLDAARASRRLSIEYTDEADGVKAETFLRKFSDQKVSYTDALSLAVAGRARVGAIFGFDRHLSLTGLPLLPGNADTV